jgi:hypothetical protein
MEEKGALFTSTIGEKRYHLTIATALYLRSVCVLNSALEA